jgi:hypothetical protein
MSGSDHQLRVATRDVRGTRTRKRNRLTQVRERLLKGRRGRHPNAIRLKENRGSSSDEGRRNAIVIVIRLGVQCANLGTGRGIAPS